MDELAGGAPDEQAAAEGAPYSEAAGRIGGEQVVMTPCRHGGLQGGTRLESVSNFGSAIANVGVIKGKWMCALAFSASLSASLRVAIANHALIRLLLHVGVITGTWMRALCMRTMTACSSFPSRRHCEV